MNIFNLLTVNRYYKMSDTELENEAAKWGIKEYGYADGNISRKKIIEQIIERNIVNNSIAAVFISILAIIISIIGLIK